MLIAEFKIKISGNMKKGELIQLDPHLDDIAIAIHKTTRIDIQVKIACQSRKQGEAVPTIRTVSLPS